MSPAASWIAHYTTGQASPVGAPVGGLYTSDSDLEKLDAKVMGEALAVDAAVHQCPALSPADQLLWAEKFSAWEAEHTTVAQALSTSLLGLGDSGMAANLTSIESDILSMQNRVHGVCPHVIGGTGGTSKDWGSVIVIVAVVAALAVGVWALAPVAVAAIVARRKAY